MGKIALVVWLLLACVNTAYTQDSIPTIESLAGLPDRFVQKVNSRTSELEAKLSEKTSKALRKFSRLELKMAKMLSRTDSLAATRIIATSKQQYTELQNLISSNSPLTISGKYIPYIDTLKTAMSFISTQSTKGAQVKEYTSKIDALQNRFKQSDLIREYINERKVALREQLKNLGFTKELARYNKQAYYYSQQVKEYQEVFKDPQKIERKVLDILQKQPVFQKYLQKFSELTSLYPQPDNVGTIVGLEGLQTRASIQQIVQQQLGTGNTNVDRLLQQNIQQSRTILDDLKQQANKMGSSNSDFEMPHFKPNNQKTKSFLKRLEFGTNFQSTKANFYFPVTTDIGLSVGYKLTDNGVIGVGASYKLGLGSNIQNIKFSHEGIGIRSYVDWKLKGSFYISGGYEQNYRERFKGFQQLDELKWQQSGLFGVSKIVSLKTKLFKKTKIQLLWDFLSYRPESTEQAIKFRIGYNF